MEDNSRMAAIRTCIDGVEWIQFSNFLPYRDSITHGFTTRLGGVSEGECSSLNLGFGRRDSRENVLENYRRVASSLQVKCENMVLSQQVHDNKIRIVSEIDRGKGILRESDIQGVDGLMTQSPEVVLVTFYADCVPLFFFDPVKRVIALSHSGWRGTVKQIGPRTLEEMQLRFGSKPQDVIIAIGPSIGSCCMEVGPEVYEQFTDSFAWVDPFVRQGEGDRLYIHLQGIIRRSLEDAGAHPDHITDAAMCTRCNRDLFFSHRGDCGKTGSLAAIMQLN